MKSTSEHLVINLIERQGCGFCLKTIDSLDRNEDLREFVQCANCHRLYHKTCAEKIVQCVYCKSTAFNRVLIDVRYKRLVPTKRIPTETIDRQFAASHVISKRRIMQIAVSSTVLTLIAIGVIVAVYNQNTHQQASLPTQNTLLGTGIQSATPILVFSKTPEKIRLPTSTILVLLTSTPISPQFQSPTPPPTQTKLNPTFTIAPTTTPVCLGKVDKAFAKAYSDVRDKIGCPELQIVDTFADQNFEHGKIIWRGNKIDNPAGDFGTFLVLHESGTWEIVSSLKFIPQKDPNDSCPNIRPPSGKRRPIRGIGKIWCNDATLNKSLGFATDIERGYVWGVYTRFTNGFMLFNFEGRALIFYYDDSAVAGKWEDGRR